MIITLKGANFSASNIGTLDSWFITRDFGSGVNYSGPTSVKKNAALNATITISSGYELNGSVSVTMGGNSVTSGVTTSGNTITISIASVTGAVTIKVPTKSTAGGGGNEDPDIPDVPDTPSGETIWYINSLEQMQETDTDITSGTECTPQTLSAWGYQENFNNKLINKIINTIEVFSCKAGHFTFGAYDKVKLEYTQKRTVEISDPQITKKYTFEDFVLGQNEIFVWDIPEGVQEERGALWYLLADDALGVDTSGWYWIDRNGKPGIEAFGDFELALSINIGYTNN